jgi:superfamily II DNA or RNA helicase
MAVRVKYDELNETQKKTIREYLCFQAKNTNFVNNRYTSTVKDPIHFFWVDKPNNEIILPYTFANVLFGIHINSFLNYPPGKFDFIGKLKPEQIPVAKEAIKQLSSTGSTTLLLPTGFGKSALSAYLASYTTSQAGGLTLVLTNRDTIQTGWIETFQKLTNAGIWVIDSKMKIPQQCNVIITMDGKFSKIPSEILKMVSTFIVDELHMFFTPSQVPVLLGCTPRYVIGCTATLDRPDGMEAMGYSMLGTHKVEVKNNKQFKVYKFCTGIQTKIEKNKQGKSDFQKLVRDLASDPIRNAFIIDLIEKNKQHKILVLTWSVGQVDFLFNLFKKRGESVDKLAGTKSTYVDSRILIGSYSKISTGFDAKNVAINWDGVAIDMLLLVGTTKSHNLHIQSIGRAFRSDFPTIIDFVDDNKISDGHWKSRRANYNKMNCEIEEIIMKKREQEMSEETSNEIHNSRLLALKNKNLS